MALSTGTRLGPYEINAPIGAGGMGEVYRARDKRLGRDVAIKVLPSEVANDRERLSRFELEAKSASALNHPNILIVHDLGTENGTAYLVTELLIGQSLRELIRGGPLRETRALAIAIDVARGLAAAHAKGIVHRDLKPENLFVTRDGTTKILDFGLARMESLEEAAAVDSSFIGTLPGTILGTPGYMAPEQVRGERADARADLFALGCVLYELLAGIGPFRRGSKMESLNATLREPAPELEARATVHREVALIVERLLEKGVEQRFQAAADLAFALSTVQSAAGGLHRGGTKAGPWLLRGRGWLFAVATGLLVTGWGTGLWFAREQHAPPREIITFELSRPAGVSLESNAEMHNLALSPDGRTLAYVAGVDGQRSIHVQDFSAIESRVLTGTEGARSLFWSPDGGAIAFFAGGKLKRVARNGGPVQIVCDVQGSNTGTWGSTGTILFSQGFGPNDGLFRVPAAGGVPTRLASAGDLPRWLDFLPDGHRYLYWDRLPTAVTGEVYIGDLETGRSTKLLPTSSRACYAEPGWLIFINSGALVAQHFDAETARLSGEPIPLASGVPYFFNGWSAFSAGGRALAYQVNPAPQPLCWHDRHGRELGSIGPAARYLAVRLSPDSRSAAASISDPVTAFTDIWIIDLLHGGSTRLSDEPFLDWAPTWSPEGDRVAYTSVNSGPQWELNVRRVLDGAKLASMPPKATFHWSRAWTEQGIYIDANDPRTGWDLLRLPTLEAELVPVFQTDFNEQGGTPSPDGKWLAFHSSESGERAIALVRLDAPSRPIRVAQALAVVPRWKIDSSELYYVSSEGWLSAVSVSGDTPPTLGTPEALFRVDLINEDSFDVTPDGQRFLLAATRPSSSLPVTVRLDWQLGLRQ